MFAQVPLLYADLRLSWSPPDESLRQLENRFGRDIDLRLRRASEFSPKVEGTGNYHECHHALSGGVECSTRGCRGLCWAKLV